MLLTILFIIDSGLCFYKELLGYLCGLASTLLWDKSSYQSIEKFMGLNLIKIVGGAWKGI